VKLPTVTTRDVGMWTSGAAVATALALGEHAFGLLSALAGVLPL